MGSIAYIDEYTRGGGRHYVLVPNDSYGSDRFSLALGSVSCQWLHVGRRVV